MTESARLSISNLDKAFAAPVLIGVNLSIARGEVHAIVGENGAGKSTLVNILAGNLRKDGGEISLDGDTSTSLRDHETRMRQGSPVPRRN